MRSELNGSGLSAAERRLNSIGPGAGRHPWRSGSPFHERAGAPGGVRTAMSAKRAVIRLQLDLAAKQALDKLCERRGMTQIAVLSRLVKWFANQDEIVQASVLNLLSEAHLGDLSQILLKRLSAKAADVNIR